MLEGSYYTYNVENVTSKELGDLWEIAEEHYTRGIDDAWGTYFTFVHVVLTQSYGTYIVSRCLDNLAKEEDGAAAPMVVDYSDAGKTEDNTDAGKTEDNTDAGKTEENTDAGNCGDEAGDHFGCDENVEEGPETDDDVAGDPKDAGDVVNDFSGDDVDQNVGGVPEGMYINPLGIENSCLKSVKRCGVTHRGISAFHQLHRFVHSP